jgi:hypothetical protein
VTRPPASTNPHLCRKVRASDSTRRPMGGAVSTCLVAVAAASYLSAAGALSACGAPRPVRRRLEAFGEGGPRFGGGVIDPDSVGPSADRGRPYVWSASGLVSVRSTDLGGLSPVSSDRGRAAGGCLGVVLGVGGESVGHLSDPAAKGRNLMGGCPGWLAGSFRPGYDQIGT